MGKFINWRRMKILSIIMLFLVMSCAMQKENQIASNSHTKKYYFVIQIEAVKEDTIFFKTIQIYTANPELFLRSKDSENVEISKLNLKDYSKGILKKSKLRKPGNLVLISTHLDKFEQNEIVYFDYLKDLNDIRLSNLFKIGV